MKIRGESMEKKGESIPTFLYSWQFHSVAYSFTRFPLLCHEKFVWMSAVGNGSMYLKKLCLNITE